MWRGTTSGRPSTCSTASPGTPTWSTWARAVAESRGLAGPFVHDLCAFGYACRLAIGQLFPGQPERLERMYGAMKTVLYPDTPVELHLWQTGPGQGAFRLVNAATGQAILGRGELDWD